MLLNMIYDTINKNKSKKVRISKILVDFYVCNFINHFSVRK